MSVVLCNKSANGVILETKIAGFSYFVNGVAKVRCKANSCYLCHHLMPGSYFPSLNQRVNDRRSLSNMMEPHVPECRSKIISDSLFVTNIPVDLPLEPTYSDRSSFCGLERLPRFYTLAKTFTFLCCFIRVIRHLPYVRLDRESTNSFCGCIHLEN